MRHGWILALAMGVSGCTMALPVPAVFQPPPRISSNALVFDGNLTLAAPEGYCVDAASRLDGPEAAFVLWGNCAAIAQDPQARQPHHRALLSATIGPASREPVARALGRYERFFRSAAGRAAMARSGLAEDLEIIETQRGAQALLLKIADHSAPQNAPVEPVYWRAITGLSGHVTALSVMPLSGSRIDDATQLALLQAFEESIRAAN
ncbi:hypothetical protein [Rhodobacter maris]|uniref:Cation transport ATPase n=1 Tax=Rhodobacter maris TaxID=446682 RepID=A0A285T325_9RHOB|nr:hypothetical protein [Rhodobacter maris]SOC13661.1 hypothetical protein SAMN05877831_11115 [Rhodobacter maris]